MTDDEASEDPARPGSRRRYTTTSVRARCREYRRISGSTRTKSGIEFRNHVEVRGEAAPVLPEEDPVLPIVDI